MQKLTISGAMGVLIGGLMLLSASAEASDGVFRLSDRGSSDAQSADGSGVVRLSDRGGVQQASFQCADACGCAPSAGYAPCCDQLLDPGCQAPCGTAGCCDNTCCGVETCCGCNPCMCDPCECGPCCERICLFAGSACSGTGCPANDWWRGQSLSWQAKNARLSDRLFGWLIPSGCCGQGCPPIGKYSVTYADQPAYTDARDTQLYSAQGYGVPVTVPLPPHVRYQYNYSSGLPASRLTPTSNYNPQTTLSPLYHQSW